MQTSGSEIAQDYDLMTEFRLRVFKLYGQLLKETEDQLTDSKLTRSRSLLLGILERVGEPITSSQIAHEMGQTRQGIGRLVSLLVKDGFLALQDNPRHRGSKLVALTAAGRAAHQQALAMHKALTERSPFPVSDQDLRTACAVMAAISANLDADPDSY